MTEEEARKFGYRAPPPPPVTAGTAYGVPGVNSGPANVGAPPPPPQPVAPAAAPVAAPTVRRVAPVAAPPPPPAPGDTGETMGVQATNAFETPAQRQARELQLRAANEAIATIEGRNVSQAQLQLQRGLNQAQAQQQSQAAGARGMGVAAARRMAARNIAELQQGGVGQTAELRAQEVAAARQQLAGIADQVRGQDIQTTDSALAAIDRAKNLANNYEVSMQDLELREKLGLLQDQRERAHLEEQRRHAMEVERLEREGQRLQADQLRAKMQADNKAFWGNIITTVATVGGAVAGGPIGGAIANRISSTAVNNYGDGVMKPGSSRG